MIVVVVALAALVGCLWVLGSRSGGRDSSGIQPLGLGTARQIVETREALEAEDLAQMLEAHNARRRRRGQPEVTVEQLEHQVIEDVNEQQRRREALLADRELDQLLAATNARRRARGLPERSRQDVEREFGQPGGDPGRSVP